MTFRKIPHLCRADLALGALAGGCVLGPVAFAALYVRLFDYSPWLVVFTPLLAVALFAGVVGAAATVARLFPRSAARIFTLTLATSLASVSLALQGAFAAAYLSNAAWGDTITLRLAATFLRLHDTALAFLPFSQTAKDKVAWVAGGLAAVLLVTTLALSLWMARTLAVRLGLTGPGAVSPGMRRLGRLAAAAGVTASAAALGCAAMLATIPQDLRGEPLTALVGLRDLARTPDGQGARLLAALADTSARSSYAAPADFRRRNVILIVVDSLRADRMQVYGYDRATTPFLAQLQANGHLTRVDMALSTCSETYCGTASLLASRPLHEISPQNFKLNSLLHDLGYRVGYFVSGDYRAWPYAAAFYGTEVDAWHEGYPGMAALDDRAILAALADERPFDGTPVFFYLHLMSAHVSGVRQPDYEQFQPARMEEARLLAFWNELTGTARYAGGVAKNQALAPSEYAALANRYDNGVVQAYAMIARIFALLGEKGYLKDSVVVITADHGDGLGEHGHVGHTRFLYQEDTHIPLLIYDPAGGSSYRNHRAATLLDIAPTLVDRLGLPVPGTWRGRSLLEPETDRVSVHQTRRGRFPCFAAVEWHGAEILKYLRCGPPDRPTLEEAYDIATDPGERDNRLAHLDPARLAGLRAAIDAAMGTKPAPACRSLECRE